MIAPTLLIGLGGTGSKIVQRVAKLVTEEQLSRIGFAVFDTDINELRDIQRANPFIKTIQTSTKLSVGEYLNIDTHARDEWFPVNSILNSKTLTEGAGQVRAISRLALETAIRQGNMEPLHQAVENLYKLEEDHSDQALRVVIVSSLAGGTGSGLILPVALYLRNYLATRFQQSANITRGFFILPEVFYEVIRGQSERNNLKCNAYATIRELDAFLMKGDGTLPEKFERTVKLEFPRVGSKDFDEYNIRPYDFCFLFDAQNTEGKKLNSFDQYLDHAASCIYAQSIGPTNKRSNSSEDNTIRELCAERGRNRYAGAGSSRLLYPVDDVREYVAIKWTQECVSNAWLKFDKMFSDQRAKNSEMLEQGITVKDADPAESYIQSVEQLADQRDPFAKALQDQCMMYDNDGLRVLGTRWDEYMKNLKAFVEQSVKQSPDLDAQREAVQGRLGDIVGGSDTYERIADAWHEIEKYWQLVVRKCDDTAQNVAYAIFQAQSDNVTAEKRNYQLETYLRDSNNSFIHPNAVRYFLYKCAALFKQELTVTNNKLNKELVAYHDETFKTMADDPETEGVETVDQLGDRKLSMRDKMKNRMGNTTDEQDDMKDIMSQMVQKADEYRVLGVLACVLKEGQNYLNSLCEAFKCFYDNFAVKISDMSRRLNEISRKYVNAAGKTTRYVCASKECLDKMVKRMPYTGGIVQIDGDLADTIYSKVRKYAIEKDKPRNAFTVIFEDGIIGYFKAKVMKEYGLRVDVDILTALEKEIELLEGEQEPAVLEQKVIKVIDNTRNLSNPFIERPLGEQRAPISACAYNPALDPHDDSPRSMLVGKVLKNFGGSADDDISRNEIVFYQAIYGLRANKLSKFSPAVEGSHGEGEYFKAYYELVNQITPSTERTPVITPHIDCRWHVVANMPDLDETNQKNLENRIYRAFMLGLLYRMIECSTTPRGKYIYKLRFGRNPEDFVVSNKTPCDEFYEVLDALTINPVIVSNILKDTNRQLDREVTSKTLFVHSKLYKSLLSLQIRQYEDIQPVTLFDLVSLLKISAPSTEFTSSRGYEILEAMLDTVHDYMARITPESELEVCFGNFVYEHYLTFYNHLDVYQAIRDTSGMVTNYLKNYDFADFLDNMQRYVCDVLKQADFEDKCDSFKQMQDLIVDITTRPMSDIVSSLKVKPSATDWE
ncbi:MAG: hypothetical protein II180_12680 [Proteobacteria bacterium]|nr:hypothetical protein [Pseudomonadota bacterium]